MCSFFSHSCSNVVCKLQVAYRWIQQEVKISVTSCVSSESFLSPVRSPGEAQFVSSEPSSASDCCAVNCGKPSPLTLCTLSVCSRWSPPHPSLPAPLGSNPGAPPLKTSRPSRLRPQPPAPPPPHTGQPCEYEATPPHQLPSLAF